MPEIKHVFSQGKMNKDLDERLVPNGQYRDALNIQVSTSEGSDVGTVQNILGNKAIKFNVPANSVCVGAIADEKNNSLYWFVTSDYIDMILEYKEGVVTPVIVDTLKNVLKFNSENIITGINIIDNLLFWTDNETEPKKINIDLCKQGTAQNGFTHTYLVVPDRNITTSDYIKIREEHITVIKKSPKNQLTLVTSKEDAIKSTVSFDFSDPNTNQLYSIGDVFVMQNFIMDNAGDSFAIGEEIRLLDSTSTDKQLPKDFDVRLLIVNNVSGIQILGQSQQSFTYPPNSYRVKILSIDPVTQNVSINWDVIQGGNNFKFYENKFARFSYRYKYQDGEYSTFAPFSDIPFLPTTFNYETKTAYNLGMENYLSKLIVKGFNTYEMLENVTEIDILYKESNSPNVYLVEKLKPTDYKGVEISTPSGFVLGNDWDANSYEINSDIIFATLPSNQLIRAWDNVPRVALGQEVSGNRIIYANYLQNYDILNEDDKPLKPILESWFENRYSSPDRKNLEPVKSLKSIRNYQVGLVYLDEYGRETPVFSNKKSSFKVPKANSSKFTQIGVSVKTNHPDWATHYKFFVKETSNEYYNLAMDRVYRAEDGNLWLSFPSSERNKVDEETFLILKKAANSDIAVEEEAKYKIIAIKNEAPEYIKTTRTLFAESSGDSVNFTPPISYFFVDASGAALGHIPVINSRSFSMSRDNWLSPINGVEFPDLAEITETLYVNFKRVDDDTYSDTYRIVDLTKSDNGSLYHITLEKPILDRDNFIYSDLVAAPIVQPADTGITGFESSLQIRFFKDIEENKPEFEGKFYVKILSDNISEEKVLNPSQSETSYETLANLPLHYFQDQLQLDDDGNYLPITLGTTDEVHSQAITETRADWENLLDYGGNDVTAGWFIDEAKYVGTHPAVSVENGLSSFPQPNSVASTQPDGVNDPGTGKGIYKDELTGQWYIEISFSKLARFGSLFTGNALDDGPAHPLNVGGINDPRIWQPDYIYDRLVANLTAGAIFRFEGDSSNSQYKINNAPSIFRRYNHTKFETVVAEHQEALDPATTSLLASVYEDFTHPTNRRITYRIPFQLLNDPLNPDPLSTTNFNGSSILETATATAAVPLIFEKIRVDDSGNALTTSNPAIWETEPKENIDLDIYYEASRAYPTSWILNETTNKSFAPVGSIVTTEIPNTIGENAKLVRWIDNIAELDTIVNDSTVNQGDLFRFTIENGEYVSAKFDGLVNPTQDLGGNDISYLVRFQREIHEDVGLGWWNCYSFGNGVESNRLRDDFNKVTIDKGAKASAPTEQTYEEERRTNGLIYSGIYNSTSGVNNLNQFIQAEKITKDLNPTFGSIQKLFSRQTDLIAFCEDRVIKILSNKDAVFNADGNANLTATNKVLGQAMPFAGDYGISQNPESFAKENFRAYFTDKQRGAVLRLSMDGLTPISQYGLSDYFSDNLKTNKILLGSYDGDKNNYNITLKDSEITISFDEKVKGWSSFKSFVPEQALTMANDYYTFKNAQVYKHHQEDVDRNTFYGTKYLSTISVILNDQPSIVKNFKTLNYEGSQSNVVQEITDVRTGYYNLNSKDGWYSPSINTDKEEGYVKEFMEKEGKWFNFIKGVDVAETLDIKTDDFSFQGVGTLKQDYLVDPNLYIEEPPVAIPGCTDVDATNYNPNATVDDGSCVYTPVVSGCMNPNATNFNPLAVVDDGSCILPVYGCTDPSAVNYSDQATVNDGSCIYLQPDETVKVYGCTDPTALNYDKEANVDDGSCIWVASNYGCTDPAALNYDPNATIDVGSCVYPVPLTLDPPSLSVATETPSLVEINLSFTDANGGVGPFTYSCTYQHSAMSSPATVMDGYISQLYPFTSYVVEIDPTPVGVQDITFVLTAVDTSNGNTISSTSIVSAGVNIPLFGSITNTIGSFVNVIDTYAINGVSDPNGGVINVLVLGNLELNVQASGGAAPYEAEIGFNHNTNQPVQYIDYAASTQNTSSSGPSYDNLVTVSFPQTTAYNVVVNSLTNFSNIIVLDDNFNYATPNPQVNIIDIECFIEDQNSDDIIVTTQVDILSANPSTFLGLYPYQ